MTERVAERKDAGEAWSRRLRAAFADPCALMEDAYGHTPLEDLAEEVAALDERSRRIVAEALLCLLGDPAAKSPSFWTNLRVFASDALLPGREHAVALQKALLSTDAADIDRRAAALGVLTNTGALITPALMNKVADLRTSSPRIWLSAAGTIADAAWLQRLFMETVPNLLAARTVNGIDIALRLTTWATRNQPILLDAVRDWLTRGDIAEDDKEPIRHWMKREGYAVGAASEQERQNERSSPNLGEELSHFLGTAFLRTSRPCVAA